PAQSFVECWKAAVAHINDKLKSADRPTLVGPFHVWYKANLQPPFLEHFSFRLGNQLFFVRLEDEVETMEGPGTLDGLLRMGGAGEGFACVMPMRRGWGGWRPVIPNWAIRDARTGAVVDPPALVTDEPVEMTDWEIHDLGVQFVRDILASQ